MSERQTKIADKIAEALTEERVRDAERLEAFNARLVRWHDDAGVVQLKSGEETTIEALVAERDRLRFEAEFLRHRMQQLGPSELVFASDVAEALGDMLDGGGS